MNNGVDGKLQMSVFDNVVEHNEKSPETMFLCRAMPYGVQISVEDTVAGGSNSVTEQNDLTCVRPLHSSLWQNRPPRLTWWAGSISYIAVVAMYRHRSLLPLLRCSHSQSRLVADAASLKVCWLCYQMYIVHTNPTCRRLIGRVPTRNALQHQNLFIWEIALELRTRLTFASENPRPNRGLGRKT